MWLKYRTIHRTRTGLTTAPAMLILRWAIIHDSQGCSGVDGCDGESVGVIASVIAGTLQPQIAQPHRKEWFDHRISALVL